jgi:uncharacterized protein (DUF1697 family)
MPTYISMLRGINVGGARQVRIEELKRSYEALGFENVRTYIQSGNLVFRSRTGNAGELREIISRRIHDTLGFDVTVIIRTKEEMGKLFSRNPFLKSKPGETDKLHVTFLADLPRPEAVAAISIARSGSDKYEIVGREIFLYCPDGYGRTKLTNNAFESKLGVRATTRNWATVNRLLEMARD